MQVLKKRHSLKIARAGNGHSCLSCQLWPVQDACCWLAARHPQLSPRERLRRCFEGCTLVVADYGLDSGPARGQTYRDGSESPAAAANLPKP